MLPAPFGSQRIEKKMTTMTPSQIETFLEAPRHAIIGTKRKDGPPQLSPVWYVYQEGRFYISIGAETAKLRNLQRDPRVGLCIDGGHPDARAVMIYGTVELVEGDDPLRKEMRWRIIRHYHESEDAARHYAQEVEDQPSALIIVTPQRIISQDFN
jgi:PPOX class probable F420-dependent enzyme